MTALRSFFSALMARRTTFEGTTFDALIEMRGVALDIGVPFSSDGIGSAPNLFNATLAPAEARSVRHFHGPQCPLA